MEQFFDDLSRQLARATTRRDAFRVLITALVGTVIAPACVMPTTTGPSCSGCEGTDGRCYTCSGDTYCTTNPPSSGSCSRPTGGVYCCSSVSNQVSGRQCQTGSCYIRSAFVCCPNGFLNYAGAGSGCYASRTDCLNAGGGKCWYETTCIP
ncbi:MAG TPA: hypothetical protein VEA16_21105 [Vicinamibacterales bacterium]|nr:hypothetical protein [Vicinamibacterales bacterium]